MTLDALDHAFATATPELLAAARRHLPRDLAEDAVQNTLVAAIERRRRFDDAQGTPLAWLRGILLQRVRDLWRHERRRTHSPLPVEPGDEASASDAAATRELAARVRREIAALAPPFRQVVQMHLERGLSVTRIAVELQIPPGTARSQLARGLTRLRQRLPLAWACIVLPTWPAVPQADALGSRHGRRTMRPSLVAAGALGAAIVGWSAAGRASPTTLDRGGEDTAEVAASGIEAPGTRTVPATSSWPAEHALRRVGLATAGRRVEVRHVVDDSPAGDLDVVIHRVTDRLPDSAIGGTTGRAVAPQRRTAGPTGFGVAPVLPPITVRTDASGTATLPILASGRYRAQARRAPAWVEFEVGPDETPPAIRLSLPPGLALYGRVVDAAGSAAVGATLHLCTPDDLECEMLTAVGPDGAFRVRDLAAGRRLRVWALSADGRRASPAVVVEAGTGDGTNVELRLTEPATHHTGTVRRATGSATAVAAPGVKVRLILPDGRTIAARTDARGRYTLDAPGPEGWLWATDEASPERLTSELRRVVAGVEQDLILHPGACLEVAPADPWISVLDLCIDDPLRGDPATGDDAGAAMVARVPCGSSMGGLPAGAFVLRDTSGHTQPVSLRSDQPTRVLWRAAAPVTTFVLRWAADGSPMVGWRIAAAERHPRSACATSDALGVARLSGCPRAVRVLPPAGTYADIAGLEQREPAVGTFGVPETSVGHPVELHIDADRWPGARLTLPLGGGSWRGEVVVLDGLGGPRLHRMVADESAVVTFAPLPPGRWQLALRGNGGAWRFLEPIVVHAGEAVTLPAYTERRPGRLVVREHVDEAARADGAELRIRTAGQLLPFDDGPWRRGEPLPLAPGTYEVLLHRRGYEPAGQVVEVESDATAQVTFAALRPARPVTLWLSGLGDAGSQVTLALSLSRDGRRLWHERRRVLDAAPFPWPLELADGAFEVELCDEHGQTVRATIDPARPQSLHLVWRR
ncbi:MAG: sigma-70 family RNA polymerase sigma factor [Planctomycetota bacterium]